MAVDRKVLQALGNQPDNKPRGDRTRVRDACGVAQRESERREQAHMRQCGNVQRPAQGRQCRVLPRSRHLRADEDREEDAHEGEASDAPIHFVVSLRSEKSQASYRLRR
jgi:hypothetical protein